MNEQEAPNSIRSLSGALQGLTSGFIVVFLALVHFDLSGHHIGFILFPVAVIYLWPSHASHSWSLFCIFLLGIFHDLASDGPLGIWAVCYLLLFIIMGKGIGRNVTFRRAVSGFGLSLLFVAGLSYGLGFVSLGAPPNIVSLLISVLTALLFFPLLFWLRIVFGGINDSMAPQRKL